MGLHASNLIKQLNAKVKQHNEKALETGQTTHFSLYTFGSVVNRLVFEAPLKFVTVREFNLRSFSINGLTAMYDGIGKAIEDLAFLNRDVKLHDDEAFVVEVLTDGDTNSDRQFSETQVNSLIAEKLRSEMWTFAFMVPNGWKSVLLRKLSVYEGNVDEWDTSSAKGFEQQSAKSAAAVNAFYAARSAGAKSVKNYFTPDLSATQSKTVRANLEECTQLFSQFDVKATDANTPKGKIEIRPFVESKVKSYTLGSAYYQLTKTEEVQPHKEIVVENIISYKLYGGPSARQLLNLPTSGSTIKVKPGDHGNYRIYIQSTSVNRHLVPGTKVLYKK
jgi:uncharacterized protein YegL